MAELSVRPLAALRHAARHSQPAMKAGAAAAALPAWRMAMVEALPTAAHWAPWAGRRPTAMTLGGLHAAGADASARRAQAAFLHRELPVRFAHCAEALRSLPLNLPSQPGVRGVLGMYADAVQRLDCCQVPDSDQRDTGFTELLRSLLMQHERANDCLGRCLQGLADEAGSTGAPAFEQLDAGLQRFFARRIGLQLLMGQHVASAKAQRDGSVGLVQLQGSLSAVAQRAASRSAVLCEVQMGQAPDIVIEEEAPESLALVPAHATYALGELLKNACRATMEAHGESGKPMPPVVCRIHHTPTGSTVQVSDRGVGMSPAELASAWRYLHSTCRGKASVLGAAAPRTDLAGYGVGLPMSRLYLRHFGGDVKLTSREGYGTDVLVTLPRHGALQEEALEPLPATALPPTPTAWPLNPRGGGEAVEPLAPSGPDFLLPHCLSA